MTAHQPGWRDKIELSALLSVVGILLLFSASVAVVLIAPGYVDRSWIEPTSRYQILCYEVADPTVFISSIASGSQDIQVVNHLKAGESLLAFQESSTLKIKAPPELEKYVTKEEEKPLKLTTKLLFLRELPQADSAESSVESSVETKRAYSTYELYDPQKSEGFSIASSDTVLENWVDEGYVIIDPTLSWHTGEGTLFVSNPREYLVKPFSYAGKKGWQIDPAGEPVQSVEALKSSERGFLSRKELIELGEHLYAIEGCWYCHTDQTRTLVQDLVLNGSAVYPAPPSSANEYIYQKITFPGTKRNGPDLSRTGIKRPSRDWHKAHFWSPKSQSAGSIMPAFRHLFDFDPRGTSPSPVRVPNYKFEALYQYLMTKGTRITPPTQAWWLGKDPLKVKEIIEGRAP